MSQATRMFLGALATFALATTGCESKSKEGAEAQAHAQIQAKAQEGAQAKSEVGPAAKANTKEPIFQVSLAGGDLVAPIVFETSKGIITSIMGPLVFILDMDEQVLSQDGKHTLTRLACQSPERKVGTYKGDKNLPIACEFFILSTTAPFKNQVLPAGEGFEWNAVVEHDGTLELLTYAEKGLTHARFGPKGFHSLSENKLTFDLQAEFKTVD